MAEDQVKALLDAIVDSGASCTYVTAGVQLQDAKAGGGHVWIANGQREKVKEVGRLGPLPNCNKVEGFQRCLISVTDLIEGFGSVVFNSAGVHVCGLHGGKEICTKIGSCTSNRLFSFDLEALKGHHEKMLAAAA